MVFGLRGIFGSSSPSKATVDGDTPRVADRVEMGSSAAGSVDASADKFDMPAESDIALSTVPAQGASSLKVPSVSQVVMPAEDEAGGASTATLQSTASNLQPTGGSLVPLNAIPDFVINDHPELKLSEYDMKRGTYCANAIAMPHNAVRLEMADMWSGIMPSLTSRPPEALTREDASDLQAWWAGFARFALTTSLVDEHVVAIAYKDIIEDFDKDAQDIRKAKRKYEEKNTVTLEIACRGMGNAVEDFTTTMSVENMQRLNTAWTQMAATLSDLYALVEAILNDIDRWRREEVAEHKDLEKNMAKIYTNKKRWGDNDAKRGEMIIVLTRWVGSEALMREWMQRCLTKRDLRNIDRWMDDYRANRLRIIDSFHQRRSM